MSQRIYVVSHDYHDIPSKYSVIKEVQHSSVPVDLKNLEQTYCMGWVLGVSVVPS